MRPAKKNSDGKRCELIAANWLFSQNCYVYSPFLEQGPVDLIAITPTRKVLLFDVKKAGRRKNGSVISRLLGDEQKKLGVRLLYVDMETHECALYPYQLESRYRSKQSQHTSDYAEQRASNRHFGGGLVPTISSLVHPESEQTAQSLTATSSQCVHPPCSLSSDPHTGQGDADQYDAHDPQTEHESQG